MSGLILCGHCERRLRAHKQSRGGQRAYYVCGGYVSSGRTVCDGLRVAQSYIEDAVLDGIQKRLERTLNPEELRRRLAEALRGEEHQADRVAAIAAQLGDVARQITRLVDALATGAADFPSLRGRLGELERERVRLEQELRTARARAAAASPERQDGVVAGLIEALSRFRDVLAAGGAGGAEGGRASVLGGDQDRKDDEAGDPAVVSPAPPS